MTPNATQTAMTPAQATLAALLSSVDTEGNWEALLAQVLLDVSIQASAMHAEVTSRLAALEARIAASQKENDQ